MDARKNEVFDAARQVIHDDSGIRRKPALVHSLQRTVKDGPERKSAPDGSNSSIEIRLQDLALKLEQVLPVQGIDPLAIVPFLALRELLGWRFHNVEG